MVKICLPGAFGAGSAAKTICPFVPEKVAQAGDANSSVAMITGPAASPTRCRRATLGRPRCRGIAKRLRAAVAMLTLRMWSSCQLASHSMAASFSGRCFKIASKPFQAASLAKISEFGADSRKKGGAVDAGLEFRILGPLEVRAGGTLVRIGGRKQRALLALLLIHANRVVSRDQLLEELLSGQPAPSAERILRVQLSRLRKVLAEGDAEPRLLARPPGYFLRVEDGELDLHAFEQRVDAGHRALAQGEPERATELLRQAESLWRGRPLVDLEFEPVARFEVRRLEARRLAAVEDRIAAELALGRHIALCPELEQLVAEHPLRERLRAQLMLALYRCCRQAEALEAYRNARSLLVEELAVEPGPQLKQLHLAILGQDMALDLPPPSDQHSPLQLPA